MKIDLSKYPPGTKFKLENGKLAMLVGESPYRKGIYIVEYGDKGGHVDFSSLDGYIIFQDLHIESVIQPDKYLVSYLTEQDEVNTIVLPINNPKALNEAVLLPIVSLKTTSLVDIPGRSKRAVKILSWSKIEE